MYVSNRIDFGHLINPQNFDPSRTHPDFYEIFDNKWDWEQRYEFSIRLEEKGDVNGILFVDISMKTTRRT